MAVQEHPRRLEQRARIRARIWLVLMVTYAAIAVADGAHRFISPPAGTHASVAANLAVSFCAGLFWPIDIVARPLLLSH
jgi:hypothetical protein